MDRDCTSACVAYSAVNELSESAKEMGMTDMHCMRLLLDLANMMSTMNSKYFDDKDDDAF